VYGQHSAQRSALEEAQRDLRNRVEQANHTANEAFANARRLRLNSDMMATNYQLSKIGVEDAKHRWQDELAKLKTLRSAVLEQVLKIQKDIIRQKSLNNDALSAVTEQRALNDATASAVTEQQALNDAAASTAAKQYAEMAKMRDEAREANDKIAAQLKEAQALVRTCQATEMRMEEVVRIMTTLRRRKRKAALQRWQAAHATRLHL